MRTLKLTHEQIDIISHALGIAEKAALDIHENINKRFVYVNGNENSNKDKSKSNEYLEKSFKFFDLLKDIENSNLDV